MNWLKHGVINITLVLVGTLVGVGLFEIGLRIGGVSYPRFSTWDRNRGFSLRPGAEGWLRNEGEAYIRINSAGLRDREHTKAKPRNALRIAVLGDSFSAAMQVSMEETFWAVLERDLNNCPSLAGRDVEVINFGVSAYGTAQELLTLRHQVWDYSPDIVLLAFFAGNDIRDNSRALRDDPLIPYFVYENDKLLLDASFRDVAVWTKFRFWAVDHSRVLQLVTEFSNNGTAIAGRSQHTREVSQRTGEEPQIAGAVYLEPRNFRWKEAWRVTERLIVLMRDEVEQKGAYFLVVTLSTGIQVDPDASVRQAFMNRLGADHLFYPDLRIKALGERENFSVLNLAQPFQVYAEQHQVFLHGTKQGMIGRGHWNAQGHHLAGKMISRQLCLDSPGPGVRNSRRSELDQ